jgi:hypothetical protein
VGCGTGRPGVTVSGMRVYFVLVALFALVSVPVWPDAWPFAVSHWGPIGVLVVVAGAAAIVRERIRGDRGGRWLTEYRDAVHRARLVPRLQHAAPVLVTYPLVIACYVGWRLWLGRNIGFTWDARIARIEGQAVSEWLVRSVAAVPAVYRITEITYGASWLVFTLGMMTVVAFARESRERTQYFVTMALVFPLAGNVLAGLLMSAGPVYYRDVVCGPDVYAETVSVISSVSHWMRPGQIALWSLHSQHARFPSTGVTAMPSMHLVVATLGAGWLWGRGARVTAVAAVLFTLAGSVITGWHYWADGVVAIAVTVLVWSLVTRAATSTGARSARTGAGT